MYCRGGLPGSGGLVPFDLPRALGRAADGDLDPPRPHRLGHLALQLDDQQAVLEAGAPPPPEDGEGGGPPRTPPPPPPGGGVAPPAPRPVAGAPPSRTR